MPNTNPDIIFENEFFIVANKPSGLLSVPDRLGLEPSLKKILIEKFGNIYTVHRIDKDTSGAIVFAKDDASHKQLSMLFQDRDIEKKYLGLVHGNVYPAEGAMDAAIMEHPSGNGKMMTHAKGKHALTEYITIEKFRRYAWMQFNIHTGRTHQIRVHCQQLGHAIVCDPLYGDPKPLLLSSLKKNFKLAIKEDKERPILSRLALHAHTLRLSFNGKEYFFEAPVPKDLRAVLQQLQKLDKL